jgi:multimeric flavodoxin WrbA
MKVLAINASPRPQGNTFALLSTVLGELEAQGIETELFHAGGRLVSGCKACMQCMSMKNKRCVTDDWITELMPKIWEADGLVLGSPTYFSDLTPELKALIDRVGYVAGANGGLLKRKVGAAVTAVRRCGGIHTLDSIQHFFLIREMIIPGSTYWNMSLARQIGDAENDEEGMRTMKVLGTNMAWLLKKLQA